MTFSIDDRWDIRHVLEELSKNEKIVDRKVMVATAGGQFIGKITQRTGQFLVLQNDEVHASMVSSRYAGKTLGSVSLIPLNAIVAVSVILAE